MKKVLCPECKGRKTVVDMVDVVFTLGMSLIFKYNKDDGRKPCPTCNKKGYINL